MLTVEDNMAAEHLEKVCKIDTSLAIIDDLWSNIYKVYDTNCPTEEYHDMCVTMDWLSEHLLNKGGTLAYLKHKYEGEDI